MSAAAVMLSLLLFGAAPASPQQTYFPSDAFNEYRLGNSFTVEWYSRNLKALDEPSLWELSQHDKQVLVYRFLWLRTFDHPISVRVMISPNGAGNVVIKVSNGAGGYGPGHLVQNESRALTTTDVADLMARIQSTDFWKIPTAESMKGVGMDGAEWVLEGVSDGNYHVVTRWSPEKGSYRKLCLFFIHDLARLKIPRSRIY
jgi:hypothetical protein